MQNLLKVLLCGLLLMLAVALGTEVVALHRSQEPSSSKSAPPVVVRKAAHATALPKTVRRVRPRSKWPHAISTAASTCHKKARAE